MMKFYQMQRTMNYCCTSIIRRNIGNEARKIILGGGDAINQSRNDCFLDHKRQQQAMAIYLAGETSKDSQKQKREDDISSPETNAFNDSYRNSLMKKRQDVTAYLSNNNNDDREKSNNSKSSNSTATTSLNESHRNSLRKKRQDVAAYLSNTNNDREKKNTSQNPDSNATTSNKPNRNSLMKKRQDVAAYLSNNSNNNDTEKKNTSPSPNSDAFSDSYRQDIAAHLSNTNNDREKKITPQSAMMRKRQDVAAYLSNANEKNTAQNQDNRQVGKTQRENLHKKRQNLADYLSRDRGKENSSNKKNGNNKKKKTKSSPSLEQQQREDWLKKERLQILEEAGFLSRAFYRNCVRSVRSLRPGNEQDEADFTEREEEDFDFKSFNMSMGPVDRQNELQSRYHYYRSHLREHFMADSECLSRDPLKIYDIDIFLHHMRSGEQRRKYILNDYRFYDFYDSKVLTDRIERFEQRAANFMKLYYQANNWMMPSKKTAMKEDTDDGLDESIFDNEDERT